LSFLELTKTEGLSLQELKTLLSESAARVSAAITKAERRLLELLQAEEASAFKEEAKLERERRKREREIQAAKEEEERKQREVEEAREKRASSLAFLKEKARHTTAPFVIGGFSFLV
jgi:hypothetical protein